MFTTTASHVLRDDAIKLVLGELILSAGVMALVLHLFRPRATDRSTLYFGCASLLYGLRLTLELNTLEAAFPRFPWHVVESSITLVIGVPFTLYLGSTIGRKFPWFIKLVLGLIAAVAAIGTVRLIQQAPMDPVWSLNGIVTVVTVAGWLYIGFFPRIPIDREVNALRTGLLAMGLSAMYQNLSVIGIVPYEGGVEPLGMVFMLGTFIYVSAARSMRLETNLISLHKELDIATKIQASLLPSLDGAMAGMEIHARYLPAGSVAGDFYDVLLDGGGLGVLIADVSGHGVPAALSASMLKVALKAQAAHMASPAEVLAGLNRTLNGALKDQFITAAYVYFNAEGRELRYAGAGHPPVLLWRASARRVESLEENGLFLGPFPWAAYAERSVPFEAGDRCLLYTDGVLEASNRKQEEFGAERLSEFLSRNAGVAADAACTSLLHEVTGWSRGGPGGQQDDITFVAIEYAGAGDSEQ